MPGLAPWQQVIEQRIDQLNLRNSPHLIEQLKFTLALAVRFNDFHVTARYIFGSQMAALHHLNAAPNGLTVADLRQFFDQHQHRRLLVGLAPTTDVYVWLNYLLTQRLVIFENGHYRINPIGQDFLPFASQLGVNEDALY
jgi:hypothetical protein